MLGGEYLYKAGGPDAEKRLDQEITHFYLVGLFVWIWFASFLLFASNLLVLKRSYAPHLPGEYVCVLGNPFEAVSSIIPRLLNVQTVQ